MREISILGSTGSIGRQTLEVVRHLNHQLPPQARRGPLEETHGQSSHSFKITGLAAGSRWEMLREQVLEFSPEVVSLATKEDAAHLKDSLPHFKGKILYGEDGIVEVASHPEVKLVVAAVVGFTGLRPVLAAIQAGKDVALANKETLVAGGEIVTRLAREHGIALLPIDSEPGAIFQCLQSLTPPSSLSKIILTASGGPFRNASPEEIKDATLGEALQHPTWKMGGKITIDSATLMNKGFEVIECHWYFQIPLSRVEVVVHPQSVIHSLVEFTDGSILAQLGAPDMRVPIQYALTFPERAQSPWRKLDLINASPFEFFPPDPVKFPCLRLAYEAATAGGTMPTVLNAANEVAVALFSQEQILFSDIPRLIEGVMESHSPDPHLTLEGIFEADRWGRDEAEKRARKLTV